MPKAFRKEPRFPELMRKIGVLPEDTEFNRRAAEYTRQTMQQLLSRDFAFRERLARKPTIIIGERKPPGANLPTDDQNPK
jgi:hypothetical protein